MKTGEVIQKLDEVAAGISESPVDERGLFWAVVWGIAESDERANYVSGWILSRSQQYNEVVTGLRVLCGHNILHIVQLHGVGLNVYRPVNEEVRAMIRGYLVRRET